MKILNATILCAGLALLAGCLSGPTITSDYVQGTDFSRYRTFAVMKRVGMAPEVDAGATLTAKVRASVTQSLAAKGFSSADPSDADFLVMVQGRINQHINVADYGYVLPPGRPWRYGGYWGPGWGSPMWDTEVTVTNTGRLAVDIIDRKSKELIWRGVARKDYVSEQPDPDRIATVVGLILAGFPPPPGAPPSSK